MELSQEEHSILINQITLAGNSFGHRPAGQRLFETTNFLSEQIVSESQEPLIMEPANGYIIGEDFPEGPDSILLEDGTKLQWEDGFLEDTRYFVSEESTQIGSYNLLDESGNRFIDETDSKPLLLDEALMIGQKESNESGPSIGDLGNMMFTENYKLMNKIYEEDTYIVDYDTYDAWAMSCEECMPAPTPTPTPILPTPTPTPTPTPRTTATPRPGRLPVSPRSAQ